MRRLGELGDKEGAGKERRKCMMKESTKKRRIKRPKEAEEERRSLRSEGIWGMRKEKEEGKEDDTERKIRRRGTDGIKCTIT